MHLIWKPRGSCSNAVYARTARTLAGPPIGQSIPSGAFMAGARRPLVNMHFLTGGKVRCSCVRGAQCRSRACRHAVPGGAVRGFGYRAQIIIIIMWESVRVLAQRVVRAYVVCVCVSCRRSYDTIAFVCWRFCIIYDFTLDAFQIF